ncbi:MAG: hypothetical protein H7X88_01655 [Gloeobacteraceae cyanobacterium ES-bin-316]|nr:hypothetical protein [Ferruginibacter sp.]
MSETIQSKNIIAETIKVNKIEDASSIPGDNPTITKEETIITKPVDPRVPEPLSPTTTIQEDITKRGQRRINLIWESTQAAIALSITWAVIYCSIVGIKSEELNYSFFLVVSVYIIRTNHQLIGGVGPKPPEANQRR